MHKSGQTVSFWSAVAMGIGAMVVELAFRAFTGRIVGKRIHNHGA